MTLREWNKRNRYQLRKTVYRSREHIGWVVTAIICSALWFVNHENQRLEAENMAWRARYTESHRRVVEASRANEAALARLEAIKGTQENIITLLKEGGRPACGCPEKPSEKRR
ncbi:TPA_asm: hypothetical protein GNB58_005327 [Salmonella enterica subsp. houtenae serovar 45:g,z51:-]|uniref:Uncharacterized protein n=1 Tax=Salmonella enterica subsp. houtenae serovar 45:g,z51:- TaxID=1967611 RepID=A0A736RDZ1_SALHO|nr:hypothetical protein [Salmonella enterica subsp. houtenae str. CFSAN000557]HAE7768130.1 hypothetical protein [Salmonella enterica subsp. houtenae serovar 45:g,z51:-]